MADDLATLDDVEAVLRREVTGREAAETARLVRLASIMVRDRFPQIDDQIARGLKSAEVVAAVVAASVARFLRDPRGVVQETTGPFSVTYAVPSGGVLGLTADEVARLKPRTTRRRGMIPLGMGLAPLPRRPYGPHGGHW